ncbi:MAG: hypothetical protein GWM90_00215 [Gemmatimonadetes bacterium]|nr:hypothetical protein [Gemmatimonadota bacterium]NIQ51950.1 hypothetical protein [Gemmatimonadota bacterium]NIU72053.1 hypothetical protein [Gammaproteobacteria bacterium]NIX42613.1 hypothetical protein [Gemmatimonadota bacterium]
MEYWEIQELLITLMAGLAVLIPVTGLTLRFAVKPFLKELADFRAKREGREIPDAAPTEARLARIEDQLETLEGSIKRLADAADFDRQLRSGKQD